MQSSSTSPGRTPTCRAYPSMAPAGAIVVHQPSVPGRWFSAATRLSAGDDDATDRNRSPRDETSACLSAGPRHHGVVMSAKPGPEAPMSASSRNTADIAGRSQADVLVLLGSRISRDTAVYAAGTAMTLPFSLVTVAVLTRFL